VVEVLLIDYPTLRLAEALSKRWTVPPLAFTALALLARILAAVAFVEGLLPWGAIGVFAGMLFDGTDGKLARIQSHDAERVGALDFISDQVATLVLVGALIFRLSPVGTLAAISAYAWLALYVICLAVGSTYFRLLPDAMREPESGFGEQVPVGSGKSSLLERLAQTYSSTARRLARFRLTPYPTIVDSEFVMFIVYPLVQQTWIVWLAALLIVPNLMFLLGSVLFVLSKSTGDRPR